MMFSDAFCREPRTGLHLRRLRQGDVAWDVAVAIPDTPAPQGGFPLLVVMDGALHFDAAAAAARALARRPEKTGVDTAIMVGIASGHDWSHDSERRERALLPDGAEHVAMLAMLAALPGEVEALAPVASSRRAILGHSFGGLFALAALGRADSAFDTCIALSPSFWRMPDLAETVARAIDGHGARILLASGEQEPRVNADLPTAAQTLAAAAQVTHRTLPGEDHGSIVFAALPMALRFAHGIVR